MSVSILNIMKHLYCAIASLPDMEQNSINHIEQGKIWGRWLGV